MTRRYLGNLELSSGLAYYAVGLIGTLCIVLLQLAVSEVSGFTEEELAQLASFDLAGYVIGTFLIVLTSQKVSWRVLAFIGLSLIALFNVVGFYTESLISISTARFFVEIGSGMMLGLALSIFSDTEKPDRSYGIALAIVLTSSMLVLFVLPQYLATYGANAVYAYHIGMALIILPFILWAPRHTLAPNEEHPEQTASTPMILIVAMAAVLIFNIGEGVVFALSGALGERSGLTDEETGNVIAWTGQFPAVIGAVVAAWLSIKKGRLGPIILGLIIFGCGFLFIISDSWQAFAATMTLTQFGFGFVTPYIALTCMDYDPSGRYAPLIPTVTLLGYAIGPAILSTMVSDVGLGLSVMYVGVGASLVCLLLSLPMSMRLDKRAKDQAEE